MISMLLNRRKLSDIIKELKTDIKEQNLTDDEYLEFAKNKLLCFELKSQQRKKRGNIIDYCGSKQ